MRFATVLVPEVGPATGPDLTRYALVCALSIGALLALAWVFRRHVAGQLRTRAARRSLQVLDVLPLSGKQKLVVVRCYDRSFLLGLGEKEVRSIAELELELAPVSDADPRVERERPAVAFGATLRAVLRSPRPALGARSELSPPALRPEREPASAAAPASPPEPERASLHEGVVA